jgi:drug/metabolite transporter (DMT)-like permease
MLQGIACLPCKLPTSTLQAAKHGVACLHVHCTTGYCAQSVALTTTSASKSAFICSLAVIFVPILDSLFSSKTAAAADGSSDSSSNSGSGKWTAALLATAGVACLELGGIEAPVIGDLWALAQPICFGKCVNMLRMFSPVS